MAFQPLSVGDVLMLSQTAWKIGRAFTQGKKSAPAEFAEVEREANSLSDALKLVAEALHADGALLDRADQDTRAAVNRILEGTQRALEDLESFVERYQVIRKKETTGGFVVERSWSEVVLANYKTFKWTTEGGDIKELRDVLSVHANAIGLTMQALQSRSLARLENTVVPMAESISRIHDRVNGDLGEKIEDVHRLILAMAQNSPSLSMRDQRYNSSIASRSARNSTSTTSTIEASSLAASPPPPMSLSRTSSHNTASTNGRVNSVNLGAAATPHFSYPTPLPLRPSKRESEHSTQSAAGRSLQGSTTGEGRIPRGDSAYYSVASSSSSRPSPAEHAFRHAQQLDTSYDQGDSQEEYDSNFASSSSTPFFRPPQRRRSIERYEDYSRTMDWGFENGSPEEARYSIGAHLDIAASPNDSAYGPSEPGSRRESNMPRRESNTLPTLFNAIDTAIEESTSPMASLSSSPAGRPARGWRFSTGAGSSATSTHNTLLPPPAMGPDTDTSSSLNVPATPSSFFATPRRARTSAAREIPDNFNNIRPAAPRTSSRRQSPVLAPAVPASFNDGPQFERQLFRNAAILCDVRGRLLEYAQLNPDEPDPRFNVEMVPACDQPARICVVRKRENRALGGTKVVTSIWTLAEPLEPGGPPIRIQQRLSEINETVPYCSYFEPEKVSLQPTDGPQTSLLFHGARWAAELLDERKTNWVNYYFASPNDAVAFQSAVFGRLLLGSYRTTKTTVIHEGFKGAFAFEEQFANIEMLRLWEDDGVSTPGAQGGVLALMHVSSNFGDGWARWWINSSRQHVRVKSDTSSPKHAKVKGIDITVVRPEKITAAAAREANAAAVMAASLAATTPSAAAAAAVPPLPTSSTASTPVVSLPVSPALSGEAPLAGVPLQRVDTSVTISPPTGESSSLPTRGQRRVREKRVTGVRIEFKTEEERDKFVGAAKRAQERLLALPEAV